MDEDLVGKINEALVKSGEREKFKQSVRDKLVKAGWFDKIRAEADKEIRARNVDMVSPQELTAIIYPRALDMVPSQVKKELHEEIRQFLDAHIRIA